MGGIILENQKNSVEKLNNFDIFCEILGFIRLIAFCLFLWFFLWAHVYAWPIPPLQFQNAIAYPIFLLIALYVHFKLWRLKHKTGLRVQIRPVKRKRGRPPKKKLIEAMTALSSKKPPCFGELKAGLPLKEECQTCTWKGECQ